MKRTVSLLFCMLLLLGLAACGNETDSETTEEPTTYTYQGPSLEEMSPPSMSTEIPIEQPKTYAEVDKSGFKLIKAKDSYWPETEATSVYSSGNTQYFIMGKGIVYAIIGSDDGSTFYSAYYDKDGNLVFMGDNDKNWYFNTDGTFDYMTYTYTVSSGAQVVSFYEGEDSRFAVYAGQTYYDGELNELTGEEQVKLVTRVAAAFSMMGGMNNL